MGKRLTREEFIEKAKKVHGDNYDYSKVEYINNKTKICVICLEHGEFWVTPRNHLSGQGKCPHCYPNHYTTEKFIEKAKKVHGDKYDYSKVEYVDAFTKVCIICSIHGEFWAKPYIHLGGSECPKCAYRSYKKTRNEFIEDARKIHGNKYDYSKVEYINNATKVCIICPIHGEFWTKPYIHLGGAECPKCTHKSIAYTQEEYLQKIKEVHGNKYDYSKVKYINNHSPIIIICPIHGEVSIIAGNLLRGSNCPKCGKDSSALMRTKSTEKFIEDAKKVHGDKYDYSQVEYINNKTKVRIICPIHGEFQIRPDMHLFHRNGCPQCSSMKNVQETLLFEHIQKQFPDLSFKHSVRGIDWLGLLELDIFDEDNKIAIEYQGIQHFLPNDRFGGINEWKKQCERDIRKIHLCAENNIALFHFSYDKQSNNYNVPYKVYTSEDELFAEIEKIIKGV